MPVRIDTGCIRRLFASAHADPLPFGAPMVGATAAALGAAAIGVVTVLDGDITANMIQSASYLAGAVGTLGIPAAMGWGGKANDSTNTSSGQATELYLKLTYGKITAKPIVFKIYELDKIADKDPVTKQEINKRLDVLKRLITEEAHQRSQDIAVDDSDMAGAKEWISQREFMRQVEQDAENKKQEAIEAAKQEIAQKKKAKAIESNTQTPGLGWKNDLYDYEQKVRSRRSTW